MPSKDPPSPQENQRNFVALSKQVYVLQPDATATPGPDDPDVVIIYGWGDARLKHVAKYADGYLELFPAAKLVLVLSPMIQTFSASLDARSKAMRPVLEAVFGDDETKEDPRILLHAMSNTGGISLAGSLNAYHDRLGKEARPLPHSLLVLDSTPGSLGFFKNAQPWSRGLALGISHWFPWPFVITQGLAFIILALIFSASWLTGKASAAAYSVAAVNNTELCDKSAKRLYLYSKEDEIIAWDAIEVHAAQATTRGYDVSLELFKGSPHVGHMRVFRDQYWAAIRKAWESQ